MCICPYLQQQNKEYFGAPIYIERKDMANKRQQSSVSMMIQRCHKWRQKRKQYIDMARQTNDEVERERLLQSAEHYCRIINEEQSKIDSTRDPKDKTPVEDIVPEATDSSESSESCFLLLFLTFFVSFASSSEFASNFS